MEPEEKEEFKVFLDGQEFPIKTIDIAVAPICESLFEGMSLERYNFEIPESSFTFKLKEPIDFNWLKLLFKIKRLPRKTKKRLKKTLDFF